MMATALVAKSGSRSFIHVSKAVQANLVPLEDDANGAFAGMPQAQFGMGGHVLGQVLDAPVGLPESARIDLGGFLTGQHQQASLDLSGVPAWGWTLGTVLEPVQAPLQETTPPHPDGAVGQAEFIGDLGIGLPSGGAQDDLRAIGILLGAGPSGHAALEFGALGRQEPDPAPTLFGHAKSCFRCFRSQPAQVRINSFSASTNRTRY
jgi:hypothetical protein